jgi:hypothetical protein
MPVCLSSISVFISMPGKRVGVHGTEATST